MPASVSRHACGLQRCGPCAAGAHAPQSHGCNAKVKLAKSARSRPERDIASQAGQVRSSNAASVFLLHRSWSTPGAGGQIRTACAYRSTRAKAKVSETTPPRRMPTSRSQASLQRKSVQQTAPVEQNAPAHAVPQLLAHRACGEPADVEIPALEAMQVEENGPRRAVRAERPLKSALRTSSSPVGAALSFRMHRNL